MRHFLLTAVCLISFAQNAKAGTTSYFDVPFQSVEKYYDSLSLIKFNDVGVNEVVKDVLVDTNSVKVVLRKENKEIVTLDLFGIYGNGTNLADELWLSPSSVVIVTRNEKDFKIWNDYISKIQKRYFLYQEKERKKRQKYFTPAKVLPPSD